MDQAAGVYNTEFSHHANDTISVKPEGSLEKTREPAFSEEKLGTPQVSGQSSESENEFNLEVWKRVMVEQLVTLGTEINQKDLAAVESSAKRILQQLGPTKTLPPTSEHRKLGLSILESLSNIILSNIGHYSQDRHYLDIACYVTDGALPFISPSHSDPADWLFNFAKCCEFRYELTKSLEDIQNAIVCFENTLRLTESGHPKQLSRIETLGDAHRRRWDQLKGSDDLTKALEYYSAAIPMAPQGSAIIPHLYVKMAGLFSAWSQADKTHEIEGLERAIEIQKHAITLVSEGNDHRSTYLHTLGRYYHHKFNRSGNKDDVQVAIDSQTEAVKLAPEGSVAKLNIMNDLGASYQARFVSMGNLEDCSTAFQLHEKVLSLAPEGDPNKVGYLSTLGNLYIQRFAYLGIKDDLSKALEILSRVVSDTPPLDHDLPGRLNNLGLAYKSRFDHFGKLSDIDKAIELQGSAIRLSAEAKRHQPAIFGNLGESFQARFSRLKRVPDIESAIVVQMRAVETTPDDHPTMPGLLNGLGSSYELRFSLKSSNPRKMDDLNVAIEHKARAIRLTPEGHPKLATYLNNLGLAYENRFLRLNEEEDSERAIKNICRAVELTPDGHADKSSWLNNLGNAYRERFRTRKALEDYEKAITAQSQAISLVDKGHSNLPMMINNMALSYFYRSEQSGDQEALEKSIDLFQQSANSPQGHPIHKFNSARILANLLLSNSRPGFIQAYQSAVDYLPQIVWLGDVANTRFYQISQFRDFIEEAAAAAIQVGEVSLALEWLEQGRSIVWGQHLQLQTPVDDLASVNSELATSLKESADELYSTVSGIFSSSASDSSSHLRPIDWNVQRQHQVADRYEELLKQVRQTPGFERFLLPKQATELFKAARSGHVVVINVHKSRCDALILSPNKEGVTHVPLPNLYYNKTLDFNTPSEILKRSSEGTGEYDGFRGIRLKSGMDQYESMLYELWVCVTKPVLEGLGYSGDQPPEELINMTWNTTGPLSLLPLHAAGDYSKPHTRLYNFAISSYTPTLSVLLRPNSSPHTHSRILAISQEATPGQAPLPCTKQELEHIKTHVSKSIHYMQLTDSQATAREVLSVMEEYDWIHLACHAYQLPHAPLNSSFKLHESDLTLQQIMQKQFRNKGLAFLSACQTAFGDKDIPNESSHLAAGMLIAGYPSVIATMWAIADRDAPLIADQVYSHLIKDGNMNYEGSARALHNAVAELRGKVGEKAFLRWAPFIHIGS